MAGVAQEAGTLNIDMVQMVSIEAVGGGEGKAGRGVRGGRKEMLLLRYEF